MYFTNRNGKKERLPDFIIPGAAKSGTTTLYQQLVGHPLVFFPKERKEPFYFSFGGDKPNYEDEQFNKIPVWRTEDYLNLYRTAGNNMLCGDASTSYLYTYQNAIHNMRELYGAELKNVKIIILLRNPIARAYSHYLYLIRNGFENRPFIEAISDEGIAKWKKKRWGFDYLKYGEYYDGVKAYMEEFDSVKILLTEDLRETQVVLRDICKFLDLSEFDTLREVAANPSGIPKNRMLVDTLRKNKLLKSVGRMMPEQTKLRAQHFRDRILKKLLKKEPMPKDAQQKLLAHYTPEIKKLENLIDRDLSGWLKS
jgi:hypothetical protein